MLVIVLGRAVIGYFVIGYNSVFNRYVNLERACYAVDLCDDVVFNASVRLYFVRGAFVYVDVFRKFEIFLKVHPNVAQLCFNLINRGV